MSQRKILGTAFLVFGVVLLYFGVNASNAPVEEISEALTGQYTDQTMVFLIGGAVSAAIGLVLLIRK